MKPEKNSSVLLPVIFGSALWIGLFLFVLQPAAAAEITIPHVEMASRGMMENDEFAVSSSISADLTLTGGYKYAFLLGLSLDLEDVIRTNYKNMPGFPIFRIAQATVHDLFGLPLELSYFIGSGDTFCTGDDFSDRFGLSPFGTDYRGFFYFPEGVSYDGIHGVQGTGFTLGLTVWEKVIPILYLYNNLIFNSDTSLGENFYSGDLRLLFHYNSFSLEAFGGVSMNSRMDLKVRGGLMLHFASERGMEFFIQGGIPGWQTNEEFSIDNLFFLVEPRLQFEKFGASITFFYHPVEYYHVFNPNEKGKADINIKFRFGNSYLNVITGGFETGGTLKIDNSEKLVIYVSPFASFISGGLQWDAKIRVRPLHTSNIMNMLDFFIGVRTAF